MASHWDAYDCEESSLAWNWHKDSRGWAMRRGHCKRLAKDTGKESHRGRNVYSRRAGCDRKRHYCWRYYEDWNHHKTARSTACARLVEEQLCVKQAKFFQEHSVRADEWLTFHLEHIEDEEEIEEDFELVEDFLPDAHWHSEDEEDEELERLTENIESGSTTASSKDDDLENSDDSDEPRVKFLCARAQSVPVTGLELSEAKLKADRAYIPLSAWMSVLCNRPVREKTPKQAKELTRWDLMMQRLEEARRSCPVEGVGRRRARQEPAVRPPPKPLTVFERLQEEFLNMHRSAFDSISPALTKTKAPMADGPIKDFMQMREKLGHPAIKPVVHGTANANYEKIYRDGFLVPGKGNFHRVVNGSAHGVGIYTAMPSSWTISRGYSRDNNKLMVCGYLDVESPVDIKRVGSVIVFFDHGLVIPMYEVEVPPDAVARPMSNNTPPPPHPYLAKMAAALVPHPRKARRAARQATAQSRKSEQQHALLAAVNFNQRDLKFLRHHLRAGAQRRRS